MNSDNRGSRSNWTPTSCWKSVWNKRGEWLMMSEPSSTKLLESWGHVKACRKLRGENFPWQSRQIAVDSLPAGSNTRRCHKWMCQVGTFDKQESITNANQVKRGQLSTAANINFDILKTGLNMIIKDNTGASFFSTYLRTLLCCLGVSEWRLLLLDCPSKHRPCQNLQLHYDSFGVYLCLSVPCCPPQHFLLSCWNSEVCVSSS